MVLYKKGTQKLRAFSVNLQGNFETNTQLGLRNQLKDETLKVGLPFFLNKFITNPANR